LNAKEL
jgi:hypothetical protein